MKKVIFSLVLLSSLSAQINAMSQRGPLFVEIGEAFDLGSKPSGTGYSWQYECDPEGVVELDKKSVAIGEQMPGSLRTTQFTFKKAKNSRMLGVQNVKCRFVYRRPWEEEKSLDEKRFVVVKLKPTTTPIGRDDFDFSHGPAILPEKQGVTSKDIDDIILQLGPGPVKHSNE